MATFAVLCEELRDAIAGGASVKRPRLGIIMLAIIIIGCWSLISGTVLVMGLSASCIEPCSISWPFSLAHRLIKD